MTQAQTLTADDSGTAQVSVQTPAFQSVWLVVDLTSGAYAVVSPPGYAPTRMPVAPTTTADLAGVGVAWPVLETFVVRPSGGIWQAVVADGRDTDADHAEGKVKLDLRSFVPMGSTNTTLTHLAEGDVLLFDDPNHFEYSVLQVQKGANGAR